MPQLHLWPPCKNCGHTRPQHFNTLDGRKAGGCQATTRTDYAVRHVKWVCACSMYKPEYKPDIDPDPASTPEPEFVKELKEVMRQMERGGINIGGEPMTDQRPLTHTTLANRQNMELCQNPDCGHGRGVHYANMPYTSPNGQVTHCARCVTGESACGGFKGQEEGELPLFEAYLGTKDTEWILHLWEGEHHARSFLRDNGPYAHVFRVRVEGLSELELVEKAEYLTVKGEG